MQMDLVQVHPTVQQDTDHAYLIGEAVRGEGAVLVDGNGNRFVNELSTRRIVSDAITALKEKSAYLVFDSQVKNASKPLIFIKNKVWSLRPKLWKSLPKNLTSRKMI